MDLYLTFLWFSSISCEPSGYSFGRRLGYCQHLCDKYFTAILQDLTCLTNCVCCIQVLFYWRWQGFLLRRYYLSRLWASFSSPLVSLSLTPCRLCKAIPRDKQRWIPLIAIMKSRGLSTAPWWTPTLMLNSSLNRLFRRTQDLVSS